MKRLVANFSFIIFLFVAAFFVAPQVVSAHCDTLDGPVVSAARKSLKTDNPNFVLVWVKPENEDEIRRVLKRAKNKRGKA